jgi:hypothetical protein
LCLVSSEMFVFRVQIELDHSLIHDRNMAMTGKDVERNLEKNLSRQINDRLVELTVKDLDMNKVHVVCFR